ncbi:MAG TPA: hypothetical protein PLQ81_05510 [bacterium]|nr:hypothetical protein [bacterium]
MLILNALIKNKICGEIFIKIKKVLTWQDSGDRFSGTRSVILDLPEKIIFCGRTINAVKIKGAGFIDEENNFFPPILKSYQKFTASGQISVKFSKTGDLTISPVKNHPIGGLFFDIAKREYYNTLKLLKKHLPVNVPIGYGCFDNLIFQNQKLGFALFGIEDKFDERVRQKIENDIEKIRLQNLKTKVKYVCLLIKKCGKLLRNFHNCGYVNTLFQLTNISINKNYCAIHDLDRAIPVYKLNKTELLCYRMLDYYTLALSTAKIAYSDRFINYRNEIMNSIAAGYFDDCRSIKELVAVDHLLFKSLLKKSANIYDLQSPVSKLLNSKK